MSAPVLQSIVDQQKVEKPTLNASPGLGAWLAEMGGSLAFTTYQSARLFLLSAGADGLTSALERIMGTAMGFAGDEKGFWIANQQQIWRFANSGPRQFGEQAVISATLSRGAYQVLSMVAPYLKGDARPLFERLAHAYLSH